MPTAKKIAHCITALYAAFNRPLLGGTLDAYEIALNGVGDSQLDAAVQRLIRRGGEHPPSAGEVFREAIGRSELDAEAAAAAAYERADRLARRGQPQPVDDVHLRHAIGAVGGWTWFCRAPEPEWHWMRRTFVAAYCESFTSPRLQQALLAERERAGLALPEMARAIAEQKRLPQPQEAK